MNNTNGNTGIAQLLLIPIPATVPGAANYVGGAENTSASNIANTDQICNYYGSYLQDDFKVNSRLTVNLGIRWEYFGQLRERFGAQSNFLPSGTFWQGTVSGGPSRRLQPLSLQPFGGIVLWHDQANSTIDDTTPINTPASLPGWGYVDIYNCGSQTMAAPCTKTLLNPNSP